MSSSNSSSIAETFPRLADELNKYPKPTSLPKPFSYGTAGFRMEAELLRSTLHRMGMLAVLRSKHQGKVREESLDIEHQ